MNILEFLKVKKIYGIIREDNSEKAIEIANAYIEGGIKYIEINSSFEVTKEISKHQDVVIAHGGVITSSQAHKALECGAKIISSPIFQPNLVRFAACHKIWLLPTATTPNEAYNAWKSRIPLIKIYPVAEMGGIHYIKDLIKPMQFLNLLPCGFVKLDEIKDYIEAGAYAVGIGRELYNIKNYNELVNKIKEVVKVADSINV